MLIDPGSGSVGSRFRAAPEYHSILKLVDGNSTTEELILQVGAGRGADRAKRERERRQNGKRGGETDARSITSNSDGVESEQGAQKLHVPGRHGQ